MQQGLKDSQLVDCNAVGRRGAHPDGERLAEVELGTRRLPIRGVGMRHRGAPQHLPMRARIDIASCACTEGADASSEASRISTCRRLEENLISDLEPCSAILVELCTHARKS